MDMLTTVALIALVIGVLGAGYCLPYQNETLGDLLAGQTSHLEACVPRNGSEGRPGFANFSPKLI